MVSCSGASPLEPRHTSQNTSHLVIYSWIDVFFFRWYKSIRIDSNLLILGTVFGLFSMPLLQILTFTSCVAGGKIALPVRLWIVPPCRAIDPCRKPIPRCTTWWFRRLQSPVKSYDLWDVVFFLRQKKTSFFLKKQLTHTYATSYLDEILHWYYSLLSKFFPKYLKHPQATELHLSTSPRATGEESPDALHRAHCIRELHQPWSHGPLSALSHKETQRDTKTPWWVLRILRNLFCFTSRNAWALHWPTSPSLSFLPSTFEKRPLNGKRRWTENTLREVL